MKQENANQNIVTIVIADDDEDDLRLVTDAFKATGVAVDLRYVENGEELMQYLHRQGDYAAPNTSPHPALILLDLNMPIKDGREALTEIKSDPKLRRIPVIVLTTSGAREDIRESYDLGANSFMTKPASFSGLVRLMSNVCQYWMESVRLPTVATMISMITIMDMLQ